MEKLIALVLIVVCITSCSHIHPTKGFHKTDEYIELGTIGKTNIHLLGNNFKVLGIPTYKEEIRLHITSVKKSKALKKQYLNQVWSTNPLIKKDTSQICFIKIDILDRIKVASAINKNNISLIEYLKDTPNSYLVSSARFACSNNTFRNLNQADAHYIRTDKKSKQWIDLYNNHKKIGEVDFSNFVILDYQLSSFCWKINEKKQIVLSHIVDQYNTCHKPATKNVEKLRKKRNKNVFKF